MLAAPWPPFREVVEAELRDGPKWTLPAVVAGGLYAAQLQRFLAHFPRERFLILEDRELAENPSGTLNRILAFLGLPRHDWGSDFPRVFEGRYDSAPDEEILRRLRDFYTGSNRDFYDLAGRSFDW
jgi:hypothetical protein